jgi:hypothetical protein
LQQQLQDIRNLEQREDIQENESSQLNVSTLEL